MTNPQTTSAAANTDRALARGCVATVQSVDTITGICSIDDGSGALSEVTYLGAAPVVGAQVVMLTFNTLSVVLGGTG